MLDRLSGVSHPEDAEGQRIRKTPLGSWWNPLQCHVAQNNLHARLRVLLCSPHYMTFYHQ